MKLISTDRILSISAILVAICAVGVSVWQGVTTREHYRLSLVPYVTSSQVISGKEDESGIYVSNGGTGPAFIKNAYIIAEGKEFDLTKNSWPKIYKHLGVKSVCFRASYFKTGSVILPSDDVQILAITRAPTTDNCSSSLIDILATSEFNIKVIYESVYEEGFSYTQRIGLSKLEIKHLEEIRITNALRKIPSL